MAHTQPKHLENDIKKDIYGICVDLCHLISLMQCNAIFNVLYKWMDACICAAKVMLVNVQSKETTN